MRFCLFLEYLGDEACKDLTLNVLVYSLSA